MKQIAPTRLGLLSLEGAVNHRLRAVGAGVLLSAHTLVQWDQVLRVRRSTARTSRRKRLHRSSEAVVQRLHYHVTTQQRMAGVIGDSGSATARSTVAAAAGPDEHSIAKPTTQDVEVSIAAATNGIDVLLLTAAGRVFIKLKLGADLRFAAVGAENFRI